MTVHVRQGIDRDTGRALERIGATREGVLRKHMIVQADYSRDSVYFSVIDEQWPEVKERLRLLADRS